MCIRRDTDSYVGKSPYWCESRVHATRLLPEVLNEPSFEKRREIFLERKEMWTAKSPEEFDPRVCDSEAFDGFKEWLEGHNKR